MRLDEILLRMRANLRRASRGHESPRYSRPIFSARAKARDEVAVLFFCPPSDGPGRTTTGIIVFTYCVTSGAADAASNAASDVARSCINFKNYTASLTAWLLDGHESHLGPPFRSACLRGRTEMNFGALASWEIRGTD